MIERMVELERPRSDIPNDALDEGVLGIPGVLVCWRTRHSEPERRPMGGWLAAEREVRFAMAKICEHHCSHTDTLCICNHEST